MPFWYVQVNESLQRVVEADSAAAAEQEVMEAVQAGLRFEAERVRGGLAALLERSKGPDRRRLLLQLDGLNSVVAPPKRVKARARLERLAAEEDATDAWVQDALAKAPPLTAARSKPLLAMLEQAWRKRAIDLLSAALPDDASTQVRRR